MSVLLAGIRGEGGEAIVRRLVSQGDEVRVIEGDGHASDVWKRLGAHVARPDCDMADLVERAAQNVRTVVIGDTLAGGRDSIEPILEGARMAGVERVVLYGARPPAPVVAAVRESRLDYVVLATGGGRHLLPGPGVGAEDLAEAVDAADDLGGHPGLELDLTKPESWAALGCGDRSGVPRA